MIQETVSPLRFSFFWVFVSPFWCRPCVQGASGKKYGWKRTWIHQLWTSVPRVAGTRMYMTTRVLFSRSRVDQYSEFSNAKRFLRELAQESTSWSDRCIFFAFVFLSQNRRWTFRQPFVWGWECAETMLFLLGPRYCQAGIGGLLSLLDGFAWFWLFVVCLAFCAHSRWTVVSQLFFLPHIFLDLSTRLPDHESKKELSFTLATSILRKKTVKPATTRN